MIYPLSMIQGFVQQIDVLKIFCLIYAAKQAQVAFGRDEGSSMKSYGALKNSQAIRAAGGNSNLLLSLIQSH